MPFTTPDYIDEPLFVICTIFNPIRYKARWKHYERFAAHVKASGAVLITVEAAFGERHHALAAGETQYETVIHEVAPTKATEFHKARTTYPHQYIKVRTHDELWLKENLINIGISRLPADWKYVAWVDADVHFTRTNWVGETVHQLQHYDFVQMFSDVIDVGPNGAPVAPHQGFMFNYLQGDSQKPPNMPGGYYPPEKPDPVNGPNKWHPGYAWAATRAAIDHVGGLLDFAILGAGDNHMAHCLIGAGEESIHPKAHPNYRKQVLEWQWRCETHIRRNVGCVSGLLIHYWHGKKVDRKYWDRWRIIVDNNFDPTVDIKYDNQGIWQLVDRQEPRSLLIRDDIRRYMRARNEDSIDLS